MNTLKNSLLFVCLPTHFKEMIRVARLMKVSGHYLPFMFFNSGYDGVERDIAICESEGIETLLFFEKTKDSRKHKWGLRVLRLVIRMALNVLDAFKYIVIPVAALLKKPCNLLRGRAKKSAERAAETSQALRAPSRELAKKQMLAKYLLITYRFIFTRVPSLLPPISQAGRAYCKYIPNILSENTIQLMVFPEHNLFYFTHLFVHFGRKRHIPSIIVPFTIANTLEWSESFYNDPSRSVEKLYNRIFAKAFPHWVHAHKGRQLILPIETILFHELFKITPPYPWLLNSGDIDFLALESDAMQAYYLEAGIEAKRLRSIGTLYNDNLYFTLQQLDVHRSQLYQSLHITSLDKPMLLCALPPDQTRDREGAFEFCNYEEINRFLLSELSKYSTEYNVIIHLHPRTLVSTVGYIHEYPVKLFPGDITEVIPLSAIYVAFCSATIRMAITCSVPVINYDIFRYRYDDFNGLEGVLTVIEKNEFIAVLGKLSEKKDFYDTVKAAQVKKSAMWGKLDGQAGKKLLTEIDLLFES